MDQYDDQGIFRKPIKFDRIIVPVDSTYHVKKLRMVVALGVAGWLFAIGIIYTVVRWVF